MIENQVFGKLLPTNESIMLILEEIRKKYQIPEISPSDDGMEILLRHELEFDWKAIHAEILENLKEAPDILSEKARMLYEMVNNYQREGIKEPELEKVSQEFRDNFNMMKVLFCHQTSEFR